MAISRTQLNWDDLKYFLVTARTGRLTAASAGLRVDHTTVARRIAALESACGAKLFDRSPKGYALTEAGRKLLPYAESAENSAIAAMDVVGGHSQQLTGTVRIGAPEGIASSIIARAANDLCTTYPELEVQIIASPRHFSLSKREADFVIAVSRPDTGRIKVYKIADYNLRLYAAQSFLAQYPTLKTIDDLRTVRGVGYISDLIFDKELDYIPDVGPNLTPHLTSTSLLVQLEWALGGAGICILPDFLAQGRPTLQPVLPDKIEFTRSFWMVLHEDLASIARIRRASTFFSERMREELAGLKSSRSDSRS